MAALRTKLTVECLEDRLTPATFGIAWPNPQHLTLSFAPDNTAVSGNPSQLYHSLSQYSTSAWQSAILQAFQDWASVTNLNIGMVSDSSAPLGINGALQSDSRFGDIRIAGEPLSSNFLAIGTPFDYTAGTWSGDVVFNTNYQFNLSPSVPYNLMTVALHEAGHSLGLPDNNDPKSVMYANYDGTKTQLASQDVKAIQALYGVRLADPFSLLYNYHNANHALPLNLSNASGGYLALALAGDVTNAGQASYYSFTAPSGSGAITVNLKTAGISLLQSQATVYDSNGKVVGTATATSPGSNISVQLANPTAGTTYSIMVAAAPQTAFGIGSYQLEVRTASAGNAPDNQIQTPGSGLADLLPDQVFGRAKHLQQRLFGSADRFEYTYQSSLETSTDVDYYRVTAIPTTPGQATVVLTAVVWGQDVGGLNPQLSVFDSQGRPVAASIVVNENSDYVIQVPNAASNQSYYVGVSASDPTNAANKGRYFLGLDTTIQQIAFSNITQTSISGGTSHQSAYGTLTTTGTQNLHLRLNVNTPTVNANVAVRMTIYDSNKNVVATTAARNGNTVTITVLLAAGNYTIRFAAATADGTSPLPTVNVNLQGTSSLGDGLGPQVANPNTGSSGSSPSSGDPTYTYSPAPAPSSSPSSSSDPFSNPYW